MAVLLTEAMLERMGSLIGWGISGHVVREHSTLLHFVPSVFGIGPMLLRSPETTAWQNVSDRLWIITAAIGFSTPEKLPLAYPLKIAWLSLKRSSLTLSSAAQSATV